MSAPWATFLEKLDLGRECRLPQHGLTLVPIVDPSPEPIDAVSLQWGIENGHTLVTEVGDGVVDRIRVQHSDAPPVLILDGEEVLGAKQNRAFSASFIVPAGSVVELPVSCVEQQRWQRTSDHFAASGRTVVTSVRATKLRRVATAVVARGEYEADQREVWTGVSNYLARTQVTSRTSSHADAVQSRREQIDQSLASLSIAPKQVGIAVVTSAGFMTLDVFGSPGLLSRMWQIITRGILADTSVKRPFDGASSMVRRCLEELARSTPDQRAARGAGEIMHLVGERHVAAAVSYNSRVYHLVATST